MITRSTKEKFERAMRKHYMFAFNYGLRPRWWELDTRPAVEGYQPPTLAEAIAAALVKGILK